jgi:hypothetical protein
MVKKKGQPASAGTVGLLQKFALAILALGLTACTSGPLKRAYPDHLDLFEQHPPAEITERSLAVEVGAPAQTTWNALLVVLNQYALVGRIDGADPAHREISYSDVTFLLIDEKPMPVMLPFQVSLEPAGMDASKMVIYCRWDLIDDDSKTKKSKERLEHLKNGMETEGLILANRVVTQATAGETWQWLRSGKEVMGAENPIEGEGEK